MKPQKRTDPPSSTSNAIERYYDTWGWIYPLIWGETIHWGFFKTRREALCVATEQWTERTVELLRPESSQRLLEIGCGPATTSRRLIERYRVCVDALDISGFQLSRARGINEDLVRDQRLMLRKANIADADGLHQSYAGAFSEAVFFHISEKRESLRQVRAALRTEARFVFDDFVLRGSPAEQDLEIAFGRFGRLRFLREPSYHRLLLESGFDIIETISISDDIARTYQRLLDNLDSQYLSQHMTVSKPAFLGLQRSFPEDNRTLVGRPACC